MSMKLSVSLPDDEVNFLDRYSELHGVGSRSAVLLKAIRSMLDMELPNTEFNSPTREFV